MVSLLTPFGMARDWKILEQMRCEPANVRFNDLFKVCEAHFGPARQSGSSHAIFKTPWQGDPRVTIQNDQGKAKADQVRQVLDAIDRLKEQKS
ncbi:toxin HicA [Burkholderia aenigmatica]|uniref:toxin HicA n=1 Tax=Burkholderia aenigmatica TaxID=2015348 RepID=UPI00264E6FF0|nr:toxin HicA [Burkholderia aenigmatica]MDN7876787.1 toxin HicA [Burkholderia aenigmatica]